MEGEAAFAAMLEAIKSYILCFMPGSFLDDFFHPPLKPRKFSFTSIQFFI